MRSCYNCGGGISDSDSFCDDNCESEYNDYVQSEAGDQADNAAEAQTLSQTNPGALATPQDRSGDPSRQAHALEQSIMEHSLAGMPNYTDHQCSNHGGTGEHDENENNVCPDCGSDWAESQREPY